MEDNDFMETMRKHREDYHALKTVIYENKERRSALLREAQELNDKTRKLEVKRDGLEEKMKQTTRLWYS